MNRDSIFFIIGNPRSGTSLFRLMLNSHPEITVPPESGFMQWLYEKYKDWSLINSNDTKDVELYCKDVMNSKKMETWNLNYSELKNEILRLKPHNYATLSKTVYQLYSKKKGLIGDKNNYYIHHTQTIKSIWPCTKYIHLIRDGRDVACSYIKLKEMSANSIYAPKMTDDIVEIAKEWSSNITKTTTFLKNENSLDIRYEDLLSDTINTLEKVCFFLDVPFSTNMLKYYTNKNHDEPIETIEWKEKTRESIDTSNSGKFRKTLSEKDILSFNTIAINQLKAYHYE